MIKIEKSDIESYVLDSTDIEDYIINILSVIDESDDKYNTKYQNITIYLDNKKLVIYKTSYKLVRFEFSRISKSYISKLIYSYFDKDISEELFRKQINNYLNKKYIKEINNAYQEYLNNNDDLLLYLLGVIKINDLDQINTINLLINDYVKNIKPKYSLVKNTILNNFDPEIVSEQLIKNIKNISINKFYPLISGLKQELWNTIFIELSKSIDNDYFIYKVLDNFKEFELINNRFSMIGINLSESASLEISPYIHSLYLKKIRERSV